MRLNPVQIFTFVGILAAGSGAGVSYARLHAKLLRSTTSSMEPVDAQLLHTDIGTRALGDAPSSPTADSSTMVPPSSVPVSVATAPATPGAASAVHPEHVIKKIPSTIPASPVSTLTGRTEAVPAPSASPSPSLPALPVTLPLIVPSTPSPVCVPNTAEENAVTANYNYQVLQIKRSYGDKMAVAFNQAQNSGFGNTAIAQGMQQELQQEQKDTLDNAASAYQHQLAMIEACYK